MPAVRWFDCLADVAFGFAFVLAAFFAAAFFVAGFAVAGFFVVFAMILTSFYAANCLKIVSGEFNRTPPTAATPLCFFSDNYDRCYNYCVAFGLIPRSLLRFKERLYLKDEQINT
ncbi:MAG: hypothetical protein LBH43_21930 [Treponema sp.]|jgi:hypothetical protein|nr:hypothetical protein [Treponema sp.]